MLSITRYLIRSLTGPVLLISFALSGILWITLSLRFIERIVSQGLALESFFFFSILLLPGVLANILPIAVLCSVIYVYYRLATESELVVLSASGCSQWTMVKPVLMMGMVTSMVAAVLFLFLAPLGNRTLRDVQYEFRNNIANIVIREGIFNSPMEGFTVFVRERRANGDLLGILVHDNRDPSRPVTMLAKRGILAMTPEGPRLLLESGNRQQLEDNRRRLSFLYFDSYALDLKTFTKAGQRGWREADERFLGELFWPNMDDASDRQNYWRLQVEAHRRLAALLFAPVFAFMAAAAVLGGEHSRRGPGRRVGIAVVAAVFMQAASFGATYVAGKAPMLIPMLYGVPLLFAVFAYFALMNTGRRTFETSAVAEGANG
jgi:lipopolysaccharide export system permease protein